MCIRWIELVVNLVNLLGQSNPKECDKISKDIVYNWISYETWFMKLFVTLCFNYKDPKVLQKWDSSDDVLILFYVIPDLSPFNNKREDSYTIYGEEDVRW